MSLGTFFKGLLKDLPTIEKDLGLAGQAAAPIVSVFDPALGTIISGLSGKIVTAITAAEQASPSAGTGTTKLALATSDVQSTISVVNEILSIEGKSITLDPVLLTNAINATVAAFNAMGILKSSLKVKPPAVAEPTVVTTSAA